MRKNYQTLHVIERDIRQHMSSLENAGDETSAAKAFVALRSAIEDYFNKAKEINSERWKVRETALKQAHQLSDFGLHEIIGAGGHTTENYFQFSQPDIISVQQNPDFHFIRLSFGLLNVRHIVLLDVKAKTLHTTQGTHHLGPADVRILIAQLKLYPAPEITRKSRPKTHWNEMAQFVALAIPLTSAEQHKAHPK